MPIAVTKAADAIATEHGKVDILVNSAGIARLNSAVETPDRNGAPSWTLTSTACSGAAGPLAAT